MQTCKRIISDRYLLYRLCGVRASGGVRYVDNLHQFLLRRVRVEVKEDRRRVGERQQSDSTDRWTVGSAVDVERLDDGPDEGRHTLEVRQADAAGGIEREDDIASGVADCKIEEGERETRNDVYDNRKRNDSDLDKDPSS